MLSVICILMLEGSKKGTWSNQHTWCNTHNRCSNIVSSISSKKKEQFLRNQKFSAHKFQQEAIVNWWKIPGWTFCEREIHNQHNRVWRDPPKSNKNYCQKQNIQTERKNFLLILSNSIKYLSQNAGFIYLLWISSLAFRNRIEKLYDFRSQISMWRTSAGPRIEINIKNK